MARFAWRKQARGDGPGCRHCREPVPDRERVRLLQSGTRSDGARPASRHQWACGNVDGAGLTVLGRRPGTVAMRADGVGTEVAVTKLEPPALPNALVPPGRARGSARPARRSAPGDGGGSDGGRGQDDADRRVGPSPCAGVVGLVVVRLHRHRWQPLLDLSDCGVRASGRRDRGGSACPARRGLPARSVTWCPRS